MTFYSHWCDVSATSWQAREHASEWAAMRSMAEKVGCTTETLRQWVRQTERDRGVRAEARHGHLR